MRSARASIIAIAMLLLSGCAEKKLARQSFPALVHQDASLAIAPGVQVVSKIAMPRNFTILSAKSVMWLRSGELLAVAGEYQGRTMILGLSAPNYHKSRIVLQDSKSGAAAEQIIDVTASPGSGDAIAALLYNRAKSRIRLVVASAAPPGVLHQIADFTGDSATLAWLNEKTLSVAVHESAPTDAALPAAAVPETSLHILYSDGHEVSKDKSLPCDIGQLIWSPAGAEAVIQRADESPLELLKLQPRRCVDLSRLGRIKFLGWAPDTKAFLYIGRLPGVNNSAGTGAFQYDVATGATHVVGLATGAAAYVEDGRIAVLGNRGLNPRTLAAQPDAWINVELALIDLPNSQMDIKSLVAQTLPTLLAESSMAYAPANNMLAIEMSIPGRPTNPFLVVSFDVSKQIAGLVAERMLGGPAIMSWSPRGDLLALIDPFSAPASITFLTLPR